MSLRLRHFSFVILCLLPLQSVLIEVPAIRPIGLPVLRPIVPSIKLPELPVISPVLDRITEPIEAIHNATEEQLINAIYHGLVVYEEQNVEPAILKEVVDKLKLPIHILRKKTLPALVNVGACIGCAAAAKYFTTRSRLNLSRDRLVDVLVFVCALFRIETERVCRGAIELNIDILIYIVKENKDLNERSLCATTFQTFGCFGKNKPNWSVDIPLGEAKERFIPTKSNEDIYRILQLTDFHLDPLYTEGATAECDEPLCCQNDQGNASTPETAAGKWGDYRNCDMPYVCLENLFDQLKKHNEQLNPNFSMIYFTGDIISHRIWNTSIESNSREFTRFYNLLKQNFPTTPIYPILGNHEVHPVNVFAPFDVISNYSNNWLYELAAREWAHWLPESALKTVRQGGYYTVLVKPGFRIIVLNSNICYTFNWWILYDSRDQFNQLAWLAQTLSNAEENNESVHILSHVPPGDSTCLQAWTHHYRLIIERFYTTITGQFNGHTHYDEFRMFYMGNKAINVAYNGGSFTPFENLNPNYRFYDIDADTHELLDYEEWFYDIAQANQDSESPPNWKKLYNFKDAYSVRSLKAEDVDVLIEEMKRNKEVLKKYQEFKVRRAEPSMLKGCRSECQENNLCSILSVEAVEAMKCGGQSLF